MECVLCAMVLEFHKTSLLHFVSSTVLGAFIFFFSTLEIKKENSKELVGVKLWSWQGWI